MKMVNADSDVCGGPLPAHAIRQPNWEFSYEASTANETLLSETKAHRANRKDS
jgi:hypothetical protein